MTESKTIEMAQKTGLYTRHVSMSDLSNFRDLCLEEAASACEQAMKDYGRHSNFICASKIRALKEKS